MALTVLTPRKILHPGRFASYRNKVRLEALSFAILKAILNSIEFLCKTIIILKGVCEMNHESYLGILFVNLTVLIIQV